MWASMYAAYEALSDKMQRMLSDLVAIHDTPRTFSRAGYRTEHLGGTQAPQVISAEHPVVRTHPESGRKGLFVNSTFTASIKGMKPAESKRCSVSSTGISRRRISVAVPMAAEVGRDMGQPLHAASSSAPTITPRIVEWNE